MMERAGEGIGERLAEAAKEIMNRDMTIAELGKINDILEEKVLSSGLESQFTGIRS